MAASGSAQAAAASVRQPLGTAEGRVRLLLASGTAASVPVLESSFELSWEGVEGGGTGVKRPSLEARTQGEYAGSSAALVGCQAAPEEPLLLRLVLVLAGLPVGGRAVPACLAAAARSPAAVNAALPTSGRHRGGSKAGLWLSWRLWAELEAKGLNIDRQGASLDTRAIILPLW